MDGSTGKLIHVGTEAIVLMGIVFYLNGQIKTLKNEVRDLRVKLEEQNQTVNTHLNKMYMTLDMLQSRSNGFHPGPFPGHLPNHIPASHQEHAVPDIGLRNRKTNKQPDQSVQQTKPKSVSFGTRPHARRVNSKIEPKRELKNEVHNVELDREEEAPTEDVLTDELKEELAAMEQEESQGEIEDGEDDDDLEVIPEPPMPDMSFVQSAIRQVPRRAAPGKTSSQKN